MSKYSIRNIDWVFWIMSIVVLGVCFLVTWITLGPERANMGWDEMLYVIWTRLILRDVY